MSINNEEKNKLIYRYLIITILPKIIFGIPILLIAFRFFTGFHHNQKFYFTIILTIIFLEIAYYIIHSLRLKKFLNLNDSDSLYKTPIYTAFHTGLNFIFFAPIIFLLLNHSQKIVTIGELLKGVWHIIPVGIIEFCYVYCLGYLIFTPLYKTFEGVKFKGLSLTEKFLIIIVPMLLFSFYNGYILSKSWVGYIYFLLYIFPIYALIRFIKEPIYSLAEGFDKILSGNYNLSINVSVVSGDELQVLKDKFQSILMLISNIVSHIKESASEVKKLAENISTGTKKLSTYNEDICNSLEGINSKSHNIRAYVELIKRYIENLSLTSKEFASQTQILNNITNKSVNLANTGEEISEEAVNMIQRGALKVKESTKNLEFLIKSFKEVKGFSSMMGAISNDTNLLALNASVEAARVGEGSEGFNVIAEEIRKLSNDSAKYLEKMTENIKEMNNAVLLFRVNTEENENISLEIKEKVEKTKTTLADVSESIAMTMNLVDQTPGIISDVSDSINEIKEAVSLVTETTEKQIANTEDISIITEKQIKTMDVTEKVAQNLFKLSEEMIKGIEHYNE